MRGTIVSASLCWLIAGLASCGVENAEEVDIASTQPLTDRAAGANQNEAEILSACDCKARCSNNPPHWTKWYPRGRARSWGACQNVAVKFCHSWTPSYGSTDASCD